MVQERKSGSEGSDSEPFLVGCFCSRDSLPDPRPVFGVLGAVVAVERDEREELLEVL
jgi:hypothetical protein